MPSNPFSLISSYLADQHFAKSPDGDIYIYADGRYVPRGEAYIRKVCAYLHDANLVRWNARTVDDYVAYVRAKCPMLPEPTVSLNRVNLANGVYLIDSKQLVPHDPRYLTTIQIPVQYDSQADCPSWKRFLSEVVPSDCIDFVFQLVAWLIVPHTGIQKAIVFSGDGANGKSLLLNAMSNFIGRDNITTFSLSDMESGRFVAARLYGKLVNICTDLPSIRLRTVNKFKQITSGDLMVGEKKYRESFEFRPFCRLILSTNSAIISDDVSDAFFRRILIVPFPNTFHEDPKVHHEIESRLSDPYEMSGVLNMALERLPIVLEKGLQIPYSVEKATLEFRARHDPVATWIKYRTVDRPDWFTETEALYRDFVKFVGDDSLDRATFVRRLIKAKPSLRRKTSDHNSTRGYLGIALKSESEAIESR